MLEFNNRSPRYHWSPVSKNTCNLTLGDILEYDQRQEHGGPRPASSHQPRRVRARARVCVARTAIGSASLLHASAGSRVLQVNGQV